MRPLFFAAAALACAVALPALAQDPLPNVGPYYIVDASAENMVLVAQGTRVRQGNEAGVTVSVISSTAATQDGIARLDMAYRFDCPARTFKTPGAAAYDVEGGFLGGIDDDQPWEAVNMDAPSADIMRLACDGTAPEGGEPLDDDLATLAGVYQEWALEQ